MFHNNYQTTLSMNGETATEALKYSQNVFNPRNKEFSMYLVFMCMSGCLRAFVKYAEKHRAGWVADITLISHSKLKDP